MITLNEATKEQKLTRELIVNIETLLDTVEKLDADTQFSKAINTVNKAIPADSQFDMYSMLKIYKKLLVQREYEISEALKNISVDIDTLI